jgi:hypothetical protein
MDGTKCIGMDVHREMSSIAVLSSAGKFVMEAVIETKAVMIQLSWTYPSQSKSEDSGLSQTTLAYRESLSSVFSLAPANP